MTDPLPAHQRTRCDTSEPLGELIAEFGENTAGVPRTVGVVLGALSVLFLAVQLLIGWHGFLVIVGVLWIVLGLLLSALGSNLNKNRLLVHAEGLVQIKGAEALSFRWRDVQKILVEEHREYATGLAHTFIITAACKATTAR